MLKKWLATWGIPTEHFDPYRFRRPSVVSKPLEEVLVEHSDYSRTTLKKRLFAEGLKDRTCEICGQGEAWRGRHMSLVLDHVNGVADDNRLGNLQIVCANCAATLDTHCGKMNRRVFDIARCDGCGNEYRPTRQEQRFCRVQCSWRWRSGRPNPASRRVSRPPYATLTREIRALGWSGTGRRYGVSDNAVRKWVRQYEREAVQQRELDAAA
ncbi:MAG TPA: hypothetical protein VIL64_03215 [Solirubrobacteraceae bacterium]